MDRRRRPNAFPRLVLGQAFCPKVNQMFHTKCVFLGAELSLCENWRFRRRRPALRLSNGVEVEGRASRDSGFLSSLYLLFVAGIGVLGCNRVPGVARLRAVSDLDCPYNQLQTPDHLERSTATVEVDGCGKSPIDGCGKSQMDASPQGPHGIVCIP
jgi:hypothetical protein